MGPPGPVVDTGKPLTSVRLPERSHQASNTDILKDVTKRPVHLRFRFVFLVFLGGTLGTAARQGLSLTIPQDAGIPWTIFVINLVGAFLLGILLESLIRRGTDFGRRRFARLLLGTGFLGGFTTYSALAVDTAMLMDDRALSSAIVYSIISVITGLIAAFAGIAVAAALHRSKHS